MHGHMYEHDKEQMQCGMPVEGGPSLCKEKL